MLTMIGACHVAARRLCISSAAIECRLDSKHDFKLTTQSTPVLLLQLCILWDSVHNVILVATARWIPLVGHPIQPGRVSVSPSWFFFDLCQTMPMPVHFPDFNLPEGDAGGAAEYDPETACSTEHEDEGEPNVEGGDAARFGIAARYIYTATVEGYAVYLPTSPGTTAVGMALDKTRGSEFPWVSFRVLPFPSGLLLTRYQNHCLE